MVVRFLGSVFGKGKKDRRRDTAGVFVEPVQNRVMRVFISSTFRDMQAERDQLILLVFPQLRKLCEQRGVVWGEVDLRWGITEEQSTDGKVLPICLEEIRTCRPYFIGILGERYGWVPDEIDDELVKKEKWLAERKGHSVTELEILHGVLNNPKMADHAYFYFRDPAYIKSLPEEKQNDFLEMPTDEEIEKYGKENAEERAAERRDKLIKLKEHILACDYPVEDDYKDPVALGKLILRDFTALIDRLFPEDEVPDQLESDALEHEAFTASRFGIYIGGKEYFDRLNDHIKGNSPPLVVLGESGSGKSALLANWAEEYRKKHPDEHFIIHFIGATPQSASWDKMLRRIMGELKRRFKIEEEIPDKPEELKPAFAKFLHMASARGRVVLMLDALNQLEDRDGAPDLIWLPPVIPKNIRLILSTLPGRPLDNLKKREWPTIEISPLDRKERRELIRAYLGQYRKILDKQHAERIASAKQASNPLYLRALLEELRVFGEFNELGKRIDHYLEAEEVADLYERILKRYEEHYEGDRPELVRDVMTLIWASRRGLSEKELLELLGEGDKPLPIAHWAPFYLAAERSLVSRSGYITFFHDYLRKAVEHLYLEFKDDKDSTHLRLADYFSKQWTAPRGIEEHPWQLSEAEEWQRLYDLLADLTFFWQAWKQYDNDICRYWTKIEGSSSSLSKIDAYKAVIEKPEDVWEKSNVWDVASLLAATGHPTEALSLQQYLIDRCSQSNDLVNLKTCLGNRARILRTIGRLDEAMELLKAVEGICLALGDSVELQMSLGSQAAILYARGDLRRAMELYKRQEHICRELNIPGSLSGCLGNQALILSDLGDLDGAMRLHKEGERICRETGSLSGLRASLGNQASILKARGDLDSAMRLHKEEERICREIGNPESLELSLGNQATIHYYRGDFDDAMMLFKEQESICRELSIPESLQGCLCNQANIHYARDDLEGAMKLYKEQERICRELDYPASLQLSLGNQALILLQLGKPDSAMKLHKEEERICRRLDDPAGLAKSFGNQALILMDCGQLDEALRLLKENERMYRKINNPKGLATSLVNQAGLYARRNQAKKGFPLAEEALRLATLHGFGHLIGQIEPILADLRRQL